MERTLRGQGDRAAARIRRRSDDPDQRPLEVVWGSVGRPGPGFGGRSGMTTRRPLTSRRGGPSCIDSSALRCWIMATGPRVGASEMSYRITITDQAETQLNALPARERRTIEAAI